MKLYQGCHNGRNLKAQGHITAKLRGTGYPGLLFTTITPRCLTFLLSSDFLSGIFSSASSEMLRFAVCYLFSLILRWEYVMTRKRYNKIDYLTITSWTSLRGGSSLRGLSEENRERLMKGKTRNPTRASCPLFFVWITMIEVDIDVYEIPKQRAASSHWQSLVFDSSLKTLI